MEPTKKVLDPSLIEILDFNIIKGEIDSPFTFDKDLVNDFNLDIDFNMGFNLEQKVIRADLMVDIKTQSSEEQEEEAAGHFDFTFVYTVHNLEQLANKNKEGEILMHGYLGNALASITYSTSRGILMTRFQGTALQNFILPVINPNDLLK